MTELDCNNKCVFHMSEEDLYPCTHCTRNKSRREIKDYFDPIKEVHKIIVKDDGSIE